MLLERKTTNRNAVPSKNLESPRIVPVYFFLSLFVCVCLFYFLFSFSVNVQNIAFCFSKFV